MRAQNEVTDEQFMRQCIRLAERGRGYVSPNPAVGALLVKDGEVLSRGYHKKYGGDHAEVECLSHYDGDCRGTTMFVNLEPCSHFGKTPPCTETIVRRGISRVVIGIIDPNPIVSGKGVRDLAKAGIDVITGTCESECRQLNKMFIKNISSKVPYVNVKIAQTLDGKIARRRQGFSWITGAASQNEVHKWRRAYDAVCVGAGAIRTDNPSLTVRHVRGRNPGVVILDGRLNVHPDSRVFTTAPERKIFIVCTENSVRNKKSHVARLTKRGVTVIPMSGPRIDIQKMLFALYQRGIGSILVEGGQKVFSQFILQHFYDEVSVFISPKSYGNGLSPCVFDLPGDDKLSYVEMTSRRLGNDVLIQLTKE